MNEEEAKERLRQFLDGRRGNNGELDPEWLGELEVEKQPDGEWFAVRRVTAPQYLHLRQDKALLVQGAIGRWSRFLGRPETRELILGSAWFGHYQRFNQGIAVWENTELSEGGQTIDTSFPIGLWESSEKRARACDAMVAFFDLRGFTNWSSRVASQPDASQQIQAVVETLEDAFQRAFATPREAWPPVFAKGLGDGLMVVSEARWGGPPDKPVEAQHATAFCTECAATVREAALALSAKDLAVGCGITTGAVTQLYLLGRYDYIGAVVNDAAKIQTVAYNELCVSDAVANLLGRNFKHTPLSGKGWRISTAEFQG